jgi:hypothetical protein
LRLSWLVLAMSPTVLHQVITGTGHATNTIYVALGLWWLTRSRHPNAAGALWGVAVASRANFLVLLPLAFGWLKQQRGGRAAATAIACTSATAAMLVLPFYAYDPAHFGPLEATDRLLRFNAVIPYAGTAVGVLMAATAVFLSCRPMNAAALFRNCAIVQSVPIIAGTLLSGWGRPALVYAMYGTFAAWFVFISAADGFGDTSSTRAPLRGAPRTASDQAAAGDPVHT